MNIPMPRQQLCHEHLHVRVLHRKLLGHVLVSAVHYVVGNWRSSGRNRVLKQTKTVILFSTKVIYNTFSELIIIIIIGDRPIHSLENHLHPVSEANHIVV